MIPKSAMRYYLNPLQSPFHTGEKMLVFREKYPRDFDSFVDKVVEVKRCTIESHHVWWITEVGGRYVDGALVSPKEMQTHTPALGILDDEVFVVGTSYGLTDDGRMVIRDAKRSDGKLLPGTEGMQPRTYLVDEWMQAASWAINCMPQPGDDQATVDLRIRLATQSFDLRLGEICILREANDRDWRDDLEDLDYSLPTPSYATAVQGSVYVAVSTGTARDDLPEDARATLDRIAERNLTGRPAPSTLTTRVEMPAQFIVKTSYEKYESVEEVNAYTLRNAAVDLFNVDNVTVGDVTKTPILRAAY
jgi:hypothetical protein